MKFKNNFQLNDKLRKLRKFYGIKMDDLANELKMGSANNYHSYEIGRSHFTLEHIQILCKRYDISLEALTDNKKELHISDLMTKTIQKIEVEDCKQVDLIIELLKKYKFLDSDTKMLIDLFFEKILKNSETNIKIKNIKEAIAG